MNKIYYCTYIFKTTARKFSKSVVIVSVGTGRSSCLCWEIYCACAVLVGAHQLAVVLANQDS